MEQQVSVNMYKRTLKDVSDADIIRFQIMLHCYLNDIYISPAKLKCLTLLGISGECELSSFCSLMVKENVFTSVESTRNTLMDIQDKNLIVKEGGYHKTIKLHPDMKIQTNGTIWVDIDMLHREQQTK